MLDLKWLIWNTQKKKAKHVSTISGFKIVLSKKKDLV